MTSGAPASTALLKVSRKPDGRPEIFHTLQGEGTMAGTAAVFLRLAQCNLACTWCDTKYTWDWKNYDYDKEVIELSPGDVEREVLSFGCTHMVVTGGEPMMQQEQMAGLIGSLKSRGFSFEVETNGTIAPTPEIASYIDQWNVSPKLATSGNTLEERYLAGALRSFASMPQAYFKFVVTRESDMDEVRRLKEDLAIPGSRVLLSPEGRTPSVLQERSAWLSELCLKENLRFSPRLHIYLWGDTRGR